MYMLHQYNHPESGLSVCGWLCTERPELDCQGADSTFANTFTLDAVIGCYLDN